MKMIYEKPNLDTFDLRYVISGKVLDGTCWTPTADDGGIVDECTDLGDPDLG